ncbi:Uncharacterised protein [Cedecea neteri]|uniref:Uncharacterized protein n=1 Tax=Cedecea neteri TaxID=158822 RepID=A0A2X2T6Q9_9ENTR|nr:Uncharacterised protein [Cedecea neteri]
MQDFAEAALGRRWRSADLADIEHLRHAADLLWEDSMFESPIETILHTAHANASLYTLRAACHKLLDYAEGAERYLSFRCQGLQVANDSLQENIRQLELDIQLLLQTQQSVSTVIQQQVSDALAGIADFVRRFETQIHSDLKTYFREGRLGAEKLHPLYPHTLTRNVDFSPGSDKLMGEDEATARTLLHKVRASSESILFAAQQTLSGELGALLSNLEASLSYTLQSALKPIEQRVSDGLKVAGFRAQISLPAFQTSQLNFNTQSAFTNVIESQEVAMSEMQPQNGMRGVLARWLNSVDWGWEDYAATHSRYVIDLEKLQQKLHDHVSTFLSQINQAITAQVDISVTAGMATFFADFTGVLDAIHSNLRQSLSAKQQNDTVLFSLQNKLEQSVRTARYIHEDTRLLRDDIQTLFSAEQ